MRWEQLYAEESLIEKEKGEGGKKKKKQKKEEVLGHNR